MNGGADLGGMHGFGPVVEETNEPLFHGKWEERAMAIIVALGACGQWNIDQSRHARESLPPADYLKFPYYRIWVEAAEKLMLERGMVTGEELKSGKQQQPAIKVRGTLRPENVWETLHSLAGAVDRPSQGEPAFSVGASVRTLNINPPSHTRLPRYARHKSGTITKVLGFHVFPDISSLGKTEDPHWLYQVQFGAQELWGESANPRDSVTLDLWEPYLEQS